MKKNKHIGSSFESFLEAENILEEINVAAIKAVLAKNLKEYMQESRVTQTEMAKRLKTSRAGLSRLLDPENYSITLITLGRAAAILGKRVNLNLVNSSTKQRKESIKK